MLYLLPCFLLILALINSDRRWRKAESWALLIPGVWISLQGSRPVSEWFGNSDHVESNPINTFFYAVLIGGSLIVLSRRRMNWGKFVANNKALILIYGYLFLSFFWSEMPLDSIKRLGKDFGCVLIALVFLTQERPGEAVRTVYTRVAYLLFPLSVVFIKFFPEIGRERTRAGDNMFTGITTQKNSLGELVFVLSLIILWDVYEIYRGEHRRGRWTQLGIRGAILLTGVWLLLKCESMTSLLCLIFGAAVMVGTICLSRMRFGKQVLIAVLVIVGVASAMDQTFGISKAILHAVGRNETLTGRTDIWRIVVQQDTDPIIGEGFYTFWNTPRGQAVKDAFMEINSAHNGYLEMYVDGGLVGDSLLVLLILVGCVRVAGQLFRGEGLWLIGLAFWSLAVLYNFSETSFFRLDLLWLLFLLVTIDYPQPFQANLYYQELDDSFTPHEPAHESF